MLVVSQTIGLAVIATAVAALGASPPPGRYLVYAALAGLGGVVGLAAFYRGMAVGAMAVVAPVSALAAIIPVSVGIARGERPSAPQYAGIALALAGAALVSTQSRSGSGGGRLATGVGLAVVAAAGFGLFFVGIDAAREQSLVWAVLMTRLASTALVVAAALWARPRLSVARRHVPALAAVGVLDLSANALFGAAADRGYVSLVSVLASLYSVGIIALAAMVLGERLERLQWLGAAAALAGVALIAAG